jgi:tRNA A37 threonylcarbamoyladenosine biosynthesis protein TsaE
LDNPNNICLIEWPEILEKYYSPDIKIFLNKLEDGNKREIEIIYT